MHGRSRTSNISQMQSRWTLCRIRARRPTSKVDTERYKAKLLNCVWREAAGRHKLSRRTAVRLGRLATVDEAFVVGAHARSDANGGTYACGSETHDPSDV